MWGSLAERGVRVVDPRQTYIDEDVRCERISPGAILHPGSRLHGSRTFLAPGAEIGREGPVVLRDAVLGEGARVDCGYVEGAVLLDRARAGWGAHFRPGTLLEEEASTAHTVGLKHTILLSFVTVGSLVNFCDCLMAGGTSRADHSEVGSGFIHFNYTPWGARGDKATPSLIGDVVHGVFLDQRRIFLGGAGGMVGPGKVGYGAIAGAGQVVRRPLADGTLSVLPTTAIKRTLGAGHLDTTEPRLRRNVEYVGQLVALQRWYEEVRLARLPTEPEHAWRRLVIGEALSTLAACVRERVGRLTDFVVERGGVAPKLNLEARVPCPLPVEPSDQDHLGWVRGLGRDDVERGVAWLTSIRDAVVGSPG